MPTALRSGTPGARSRARSTARKLVVLAVLGWLVLPGTAGAHTEVLRAEPQPGTEVGAADQVRLTFLDPVLPGTTIDVTDDAGRPVAGLGPTEQGADGRTATVSFDPLTAAGGYVVEYRFTAEDGDTQLETYRFTLRPAALGAGAGTAAGEDDGLRTDAAGIGAASLLGATLLAGLAVALVRRAHPRP